MVMITRAIRLSFCSVAANKKGDLKPDHLLELSHQCLELIPDRRPVGRFD